MVERRGLVVVAAIMMTSAPASARERLLHRFDDLGHVTALAQADDGALWMGTASGLRRHDGRAWAPVRHDLIRGRIARLASHPDGLLAAEEFAAAWLLPRDGGAPHRLVDDTGHAFVGPIGLAVGDSGAVWIVEQRGVWTGGPRTLHRVPVPSALIDELPRVVALAADGRAFIATRRGLWRVATDGTAERLTDAGPPAALLVEGDGVLHLAWDGELTRWRGDALAHVFALDPRTTRARRGISLARRGATLWVAYDLALVALRPDRAPEILTAADEIPSGGPLLVDDEGTLLLGTFRGLRQLPEPETVAYTEADGMPSDHGRFVAVTAEGAWLATWQGLGLVRPGASRATAIDVPDMVVRKPMCVDGTGRLWSGAARRLFLRDAGVTHLIDFAGADFHDCVAEGAAIWIGSDAGVFIIDAPTTTPIRVATPPGDDGGAPRAEHLALDRRGRLWIARGAEVCVVARTAANDVTAWTCVALPPDHRINDLWATPSNTVWIATRPGGVFRVVGGGHLPMRVEPLPGVAGLTSEVVSTLAPSPRGGVWVSAGSPVRVVEDLDTSDGWRVVERPGPWQGLVSAGVTHVAEMRAGDLWMASSAGLIAVPVSARGGPPSPPAVDIVELRGEGRPLPASTRVALPAGSNAIELGFAARTRRAPELVRYRVRIGGGVWSPARTTTELRLLDLPSGSRMIEVAASLDGEAWGPVAQLTVDVATPWFRRTWVWLAAALLVAAALGLVHRARLAAHVRLERQRLRIAMDLHDEMGSGLGSISVLAGVASAELDADTAVRREVATTIAATAADLGAALGDIVWSLQRGACTLDELARRLRTRAAATFAAGEVELELELAGLPAVVLSPATARAVQLIGHEAMHNAARHARARKVSVGFRPQADRRWSLWIEDDGVGLGAADAGDGLGLTSMRRRARAIGAKLTIGAGPGGRGTRVELHFRLDAEDHRVVERGGRGERRWS